MKTELKCSKKKIYKNFFYILFQFHFLFQFHLFSFLISVFIAVAQFVGAQNGKTCGHEDFIKCAEPFEMLNLSPDSYAAVEKEELDKLCQYVSLFFFLILSGII